MEISTGLIIIVFFVMPGVLAEKISHMIDAPGKKTVSTFSETVTGVLFSLPIIVITASIFAFIYRIGSVDEYKGWFDRTFHILLFIALIGVVSIILGVVKGAFYEKTVIWIINKIRGVIGRPEYSPNTCWQLFLTKQMHHKEK